LQFKFKRNIKKNVDNEQMLLYNKSCVTALKKK